MNNHVPEQLQGVALNPAGLNSLVNQTCDRGITRTSRERLINHLIEMMLMAGSDMSSKFEIGQEYNFDTLAFNLNYKVFGKHHFKLIIKGNDELCEPIEIETKHTMITSKGMPVSRQSLVTKLTSLMLKNTQEDMIIEVSKIAS